MPKPSFDQSIRIEQSAVGSTIISGDGNTVNVIHLSLEQTNEQEEVDSLSDLGINPYQGLGVFQESNSEYYFGREAQIERLWQHFQELHERSKQTDSVPRLLPILGPSGCGKSSLARAGLIPELAKQPLSDKTRARVAVLVPGIKPVESLAGVLAKVVTQNSMPVRMAREFQEELHHSNTTGTYDGMRRIVDFIPQINESPLVLLVDQFEEVYSLCEKHNERDVFIKNLLHASSSPTGNVSVVITLRSDFLGETQTHESLNQIISSKYSIFVPAMTKAELRHAIAKPAEKAGFNFSEAMIDLLVKDTENREGALPLLQFALTHMWEEMRKGISPSTTYQSIGGIGGSLAKKAEIIYNSLNQAEKAIARRVFIGLVKLGEGTPDTRRRVTMANLVTNQDNLELVHRVINRFSSPAARLISLSSQSNHKTAEITHETLFDHWTLLRNWIDENREDIRFQRRLETAANYWSQQERATGLLWRSPDLEILRKFSERTQLNMPSLAAEFFAESNKAEKKEKQLKSYGLMGLISGLAVTTTLSIFAGYKVHQAERRRMEFYEVTAENLTDTDVLASLVNGLAAVGLGSSSFVKAPNFRKDALVTPAILDRPNRIRQFSSIASYITQIESVTFNPNGQNVGSGNFDGTVRLWDLQGNPIGEPFLGHSDSVTSVAFSPDGQTIVSGSDDETIRLWDLQGNPIGEPFLGHSDSVTSVAFSPDGQTIVSGSDDETIRLWDLQGNPIKEPFLGHSAPVTSVAFSPDGQTIVSGSGDRTLRLWNKQGNPVGEPFLGHSDSVTSVAFSPDGQTIVSSSGDRTLRLWNKQGNPIGEPFLGHSDWIWSVTFSSDGQTIVSSSADQTILFWNPQGSLITESFRGHSALVNSVAFSSDSRSIVSGSFDGTLRLWNKQGNLATTSFQGHSNSVTSVAFSPDGQTIVSGSADQTVKLWDLQGKSIGEPFLGHSAQVFSVAFSPDGQTIVSSSADQTVKLWPTLLSDGWIAYTCSHLQSYLQVRRRTEDVIREAWRTCMVYQER